MFKEGASFLLNEGSVPSSIVDATNWENKVVQGSGKVTGSEWALTVPYSRGEFEVSYTLSKSTRQFDEINFGKEFAYRFDRTHNFHISGSAKINKVLSAGFNWVYGSGTPITLTESRFLYESPGIGLIPSNLEVLAFGEKNAYRLPAYHRLDLSLSASWQRPKATHTINLSLYNVYNRKNILHVSYVADETTQTYGYQKYTVLPFIPSISYQIRL